MTPEPFKSLLIAASKSKCMATIEQVSRELRKAHPELFAPVECVSCNKSILSTGENAETLYCKVLAEKFNKTRIIQCGDYALRNGK